MKRKALALACALLASLCLVGTAAAASWSPAGNLTLARIAPHCAERRRTKVVHAALQFFADRGRHAVAYAKGAEAIADALAVAGASDAVLVFEERAVLGATRAGANRLANADHANLVRTSRAAHDQILALRRLDLEELPPKLREIAELRLRHPTLSLRELALRCEPPSTKATAHRRLRKLVRLAEL